MKNINNEKILKSEVFSMQNKTEKNCPEYYVNKLTNFINKKIIEGWQVNTICDTVVNKEKTCTFIIFEREKEEKKLLKILG